MLKEEKSLRQFIKLILENESIDNEDLYDNFLEEFHKYNKEIGLIKITKDQLKNAAQNHVNNFGGTEAEYLNTLKNKIQAKRQKQRGVEGKVTFGDLKSYLRLLKGTYTMKDIGKIVGNLSLGWALSPISSFAEWANIGSLGESLLSEFTQDQISSFAQEKIETQENKSTFRVIKDKISNWKRRSGVNSVSLQEILLSIYGLNEKKGMHKLMIDDKISKLVDDKLEKKFITDVLLELIMKQEDNKVINPDFVYKEFIKYTKQTIGSYATS